MGTCAARRGADDVLGRGDLDDLGEIHERRRAEQEAQDARDEAQDEQALRAGDADAEADVHDGEQANADQHDKKEAIKVRVVAGAVRASKYAASARVASRYAAASDDFDEDELDGAALGSLQHDRAHDDEVGHPPQDAGVPESQSMHDLVAKYRKSPHKVRQPKRRHDEGDAGMAGGLGVLDAGDGDGVAATDGDDAHDINRIVNEARQHEMEEALRDMEGRGGGQIGSLRLS